MENNPDLFTHSGKQQYFYQNRMGRVIILAMEEILGQSRLNAVLTLVNLPEYINNFPPYDQDLIVSFELIRHLQVGFEGAYGPRAGRGLAIQVGRACFNYGLREFGPELGLTDLAFRLLPLQTKIKNGSEACAALFNNFTNQHVCLDRDEKYFYWHVERCPLCWDRHAEAPCCHLAVGLLQEALFWVSGGKYFEVEEKKCIACSDSTCTFVIDRTPLG